MQRWFLVLVGIFVPIVSAFLEEQLLSYDAMDGM